MVTQRTLTRTEVPQVWTIDRREVIHNIYRLVDGKLELTPAYFDMQGWPPGEDELYTPILLDCFDRGGWFFGLFDGAHLVGVAVLDSQFIGQPADMLQLKFLHVGAAHRGQGYGRLLFACAAAEASHRGAQRMYVSATPSEHTIGFYLELGCIVAREPDPELLALEPEDIHLEYLLLSDKG